MPRISLLLPSVRPALAAQCLASIRATAEGCDYEVIVVGPFAVAGADVRWVEMTERRGVAVAQQAALAASSGELVVALSDYLLPRPGWLASLVHALEAVGDAPVVLSPFWANAIRGQPAFGFVFGLHYAYFPSASRRTIERIGGWYDEAYVSEYCDCDIGLRAWRAGGYCDVVWSSVVIASHRRVEREASASERPLRRTDDDSAIFLDRWHPVLGAGWPREANQINVDLPASMVVDPRVSRVRLRPTESSEATRAIENPPSYPDPPPS